MAYHIIGNYRPPDPRQIVSRFTNFLRQHAEYLEVLFRILTYAKDYQQYQHCGYIYYKEEILQLVIEISLLEGIINKTHLAEFNNLLQQFCRQDVSDCGNTRGKFLENIITEFGPLHFSGRQMERKNKCQVVDSSGNKVGGNKDFDVGFHNHYTCDEDMEAELLECKIDLGNFLSVVPTFLNSQAKEKLAYMEAVRKALCTCKDVVVGFVTLVEDVVLFEKLLKTLGYDKILIYKRQDILRLVTHLSTS